MWFFLFLEVDQNRFYEGQRSQKNMISKQTYISFLKYSDTLRSTRDKSSKNIKETIYYFRCIYIVINHWNVKINIIHCKSGRYDIYKYFTRAFNELKNITGDFAVNTGCTFR